LGIGINSGGMSKGGPIWPGGKSSQGQSLKPAEEAFELHKDVSAPGLKSASGSSAIQDASPQTSSTAAAATGASTQIKSLSVKDILQQLAIINVPVNEQNQELALLMAAHGIEISEESFALINKLLKGKKSKLDKESAILMVSKGLGGVADDTDILSGILSKKSTISNTLNTIQSMQSKMMGVFQNTIQNQTLLQSFTALFDEFNEHLRKLKKLHLDNQSMANPLSILDDALAMGSFIKGLAHHQNLNNRHVNKYLDHMDEFIKNLMGQMILSQDSVKQPLGLLESFHYFQLPHPLSAQAVIEMLLRKQSRGSQNKRAKGQENASQEKVIISMETETMGTITVIVVVMGIKVWCNVYSDQDSAINHANAFRNELAVNLKKYDYNLEEFKSTRKKINLKKFIAPSQDISEVKRIQTEI
jgi:hypothetical protein